MSVVPELLSKLMRTGIFSHPMDESYYTVNQSKISLAQGTTFDEARDEVNPLSQTPTNYGASMLNQMFKEGRGGQGNGPIRRNKKHP